MVVTFLLCLGLLDDLGHEILDVIHPEGRCDLLFRPLVELLIDVGNLIDEGLVEVRHDQLRTRNLTADVIRLQTRVYKLRIHRLEISINLKINLGHHIQHFALHFSELFLDIALIWRAVVLDYFGESILITLEFDHAKDILQACYHLFVLFLHRKC